jgi:wyosine [tRNA(Phe)-imidazoG37] synthetase (radical SAM superfamily)
MIDAGDVRLKEGRAVYAKNIYKDIVYGPIRSRRLGVDLGINPLGPWRKWCSFDCPYCQDGWTVVHDLGEDPKRETPSVTIIAEAVEARLRELREEGVVLDAITLVGNGEPTVHPDFPGVVACVREVQRRLAPTARLGVLSNASTLMRPEIREALMALDVRYMKLDAGDPQTFNAVNKPAPGITFEMVVEGLRLLPEKILQSMFVNGAMDNTGPKQIEDWIATVASVRPSEVQVYSLARRPADRTLRPVPPERLQEIAAQLQRATGIPAVVF